MDYRKAQAAYANDPQYHQLVDVLVNLIDGLQFTPSEVRETAVFACMLHEMRNPQPMIINMQTRPDEKDARSCKG